MTRTIYLRWLMLGQPECNSDGFHQVYLGNSCYLCTRTFPRTCDQDVHTPVVEFGEEAAMLISVDPFFRVNLNILSGNVILYATSSLFLFRMDLLWLGMPRHLEQPSKFATSAKHRLRSGNTRWCIECRFSKDVDTNRFHLSDTQFSVVTNLKRSHWKMQSSSKLK
jgi:hypothetical protein